MNVNAKLAILDEFELKTYLKKFGIYEYFDSITEYGIESISDFLSLDELCINNIELLYYLKCINISQYFSSMIAYGVDSVCDIKLLIDSDMDNIFEKGTKIKVKPFHRIKLKRIVGCRYELKLKYAWNLIKKDIPIYNSLFGNLFETDEMQI